MRKPKLVEKLINKGSLRAGRCIEIAGGSPLTEKGIHLQLRKVKSTQNVLVNSESKLCRILVSYS